MVNDGIDVLNKPSVSMKELTGGSDTYYSQYTHCILQYTFFIGTQRNESSTMIPSTYVISEHGIQMDQRKVIAVKTLC